MLMRTWVSAVVGGVRVGSGGEMTTGKGYAPDSVEMGESGATVVGSGIAITWPAPALLV